MQSGETNPWPGVKNENYDACYDRDTSNISSETVNDGLVNPKSSQIGHLFCTILAVHLGHGIFHPGSKQFWFLVFGRGLKFPN